MASIRFPHRRKLKSWPASGLGEKMKEGESAKIFSICARAPSQDVQKCSHKMANRGWTRRIRENLDRHKFICVGLICLTYVQTGAKLLHKSPRLNVLFFQDIEVFKAKITFILGAVKISSMSASVFLFQLTFYHKESVFIKPRTDSPKVWRRGISLQLWNLCRLDKCRSRNDQLVTLHVGWKWPTTDVEDLTLCLETRSDFIQEDAKSCSPDLHRSWRWVIRVFDVIESVTRVWRCHQSVGKDLKEAYGLNGPR